MKFSMSQAAKEVGKSKPTIAKAIKSGRLSAKKAASGIGYEIDASELFRVYPKQSDTANVETKGHTKSSASHDLSLLELENKNLRETLEREKQALEQALERESDMRAILKQSQALLVDHSSKAKKWFWQK